MSSEPALGGWAAGSPRGRARTKASVGSGTCDRGANRTETMSKTTMLSDGISTTPDYVEACQWLMLASSDSDDRLSQIRLRRVKAKLTTEQLSQAQDRADAVNHQLELKEKKKKSAPTPH